MFYRAAEAAYWLLAIANRVTHLRKSTFCFIFVASQKEVAPLGRNLIKKFFNPSKTAQISASPPSKTSTKKAALPQAAFLNLFKKQQ